MSVIRIEHLKKAYPSVTPLRDVTLKINDGDVISVIGPSGAGKSTLLRCINMLEKPTAGRIWLNDTEITAKNCDIGTVRQKIGMVFQSFNLFSHLTVIGNVMLAPVDLLGLSRQKAYDRGMELLRMTGLAGKAMCFPDELSGGQKQRAAIARTLAMEPEVILMDEPTSALDPTMTGEVQSVIRELAKNGRTMMIVTHEMDLARAISNRVLYLDEGGICEDGTPEEIFEHPQNELTRRFVRKLKVFETVIDSRNCDLIGSGEELDRYLAKNEVPLPERNRIRLAVEELVQQIILPRYKEPFIRVIAEYSLKDGECCIKVTYKGERFDISDTDNTLSLSVLKNTSGRISYRYSDDEEEQNSVELWIKQ